MMRSVVASAFVAVCLSMSTQGAPPAVVVAKRPSLVCPETELGNADLQARYTTMWERYSADIDEATKKVRGEIEKQTKSATSAGHLDLALFWKATGKEFEQKGELRWDEPSLKKTWGDRFGDASFPAEFSIAVKKASEAYASARRNLEKGYGELVVEFTKAEKLEEALKVRGEIKDLLAEKAPAPEPIQRPKRLTSEEQTADLVKRRTGLWGKGSYNLATGELTLKYDFTDPAQINDFVVSPDPTTATVRQGRLVISPKGIAKHRMEFLRVTVSGTVVTQSATAGKKPAIRLAISANPKVFAYGSGSMRTDDGWIDVGGIKPGEPSRFEWAVGSPQMRFSSGGKAGVLACTLQQVGSPILEGTDEGCAFTELVISGQVTDFWRKGFEESEEE